MRSSPRNKMEILDSKLNLARCCSFSLFLSGWVSEWAIGFDWIGFMGRVLYYSVGKSEFEFECLFFPLPFLLDVGIV